MGIEAGVYSDALSALGRGAARVGKAFGSDGHGGRERAVRPLEEGFEISPQPFRDRAGKIKPQADLVVGEDQGGGVQTSTSHALWRRTTATTPATSIWCLA